MSNKFEQFVTPIGTLRYCYLNPGEPDEYKGKSKYKTDLIADEEKFNELTCKCDEVLKAFLSKEGIDPEEREVDQVVRAGTDKDDKPITFIKVKMNSSYEKSGKLVPLRPVRKNANGSAMADDVRIGPGSKGRLAIDLVPYDTKGHVGVSLRLQGLQIGVLKEGGGMSFDSIEEDDDCFGEDL